MVSNRSFRAGRLLTVSAALMMLDAACSGGGATGTPAASAPAAPASVAPASSATSAAPSAVPSAAVTPAPSSSTEAVKLAFDLANKATAGQAAEYQGSSGKTLGFVAAQLSNDGFRAEYVGFLVGAIQANMSVVTLDAENDATKQLNMVQDLITRKVDAIVFTPVDSAADSAAVVDANNAGIPIIAVDRSTTGGKVTALVESDNTAIGSTGADLLAQAAKADNVPLSSLKVFELMGDQTTSAGVERHQGFVSQAKALGLDIVAAIDAKWDAAKGNAAVLDAFQAHPGINAIYDASGCAYFSGVDSALKSLKKLYKIGDPNHIIWITTDGCPGDVQAVRNGYIDGDSAQALFLMGQKGAEFAVDAVNGKPIPESQVLLAPDAITPANVDSPTHWANVLRAASGS